MLLGCPISATLACLPSTRCWAGGAPGEFLPQKYSDQLSDGKTNGRVIEDNLVGLQILVESRRCGIRIRKEE